MLKLLPPGDLALHVPRGYHAESAMNVQADHHRHPIRHLHGCLPSLWCSGYSQQQREYPNDQAEVGSLHSFSLYAINAGQYTFRQETAFHAITFEQAFSLQRARLYVPGEHGIFSNIIRVPITLPPERFRGVPKRNEGGSSVPTTE